MMWIDLQPGDGDPYGFQAATIVHHFDAQPLPMRFCDFPPFTSHAHGTETGTQWASFSLGIIMLING